MKKVPKLHPLSNPVETLMCPLGKIMKIAHLHHQPEKKAMESCLQNYRDTLHPATDVSAAAMMFRDDKQTHFPQENESQKRSVSRREIETTEQINRSKYQKEDDIRGDKFLMRIYTKQRKFDPILPQNHTKF